MFSCSRSHTRASAPAATPTRAQPPAAAQLARVSRHHLRRRCDSTATTAMHLDGWQCLRHPGTLLGEAAYERLRTRAVAVRDCSSQRRRSSNTSLGTWRHSSAEGRRTLVLCLRFLRFYDPNLHRIQAVSRSCYTTTRLALSATRLQLHAQQAVGV